MIYFKESFFGKIHRYFNKYGFCKDKNFSDTKNRIYLNLE